MSDVVCPNCREKISFQNQMAFDNEQMKILGIVYMLECVKCGVVFLSDIRTGKKAEKKDIDKIKKSLDKLDKLI